MSDDDNSSFERIENEDYGLEIAGPSVRNRSPVPTEQDHPVRLEESVEYTPSLLEEIPGCTPKLTKVLLELPPSMTQDKKDHIAQEETSVKSSLSVNTKVSSTYSMIGRFQHLHTASVQGDNEENRINGSDPQEEEEDKKPAAIDSRKRVSDWSMVDYSKTAHRRKKNSFDDDSFSSWNTSVGRDDTESLSDAISIAASSTISGFDIISLGGSTQIACPRCTFHNVLPWTVCQMCDFALQANPSFDADALLAQQLQEQEHQSAFKTVERNEAEHKRLLFSERPLVQSQALTQCVYSYLEGQRNRSTTGWKQVFKAGYEIVPQHYMVFHASQFIERAMDQHTSGRGLHLYLRYHFFPKMNGLSIQQLRKDGFLRDSVFSIEPDAALKAAMTAFNYTCFGNLSTTLRTIPEAEEFGSASIQPKLHERAYDNTIYVGCIAAILKGYDSRDEWIGDNACITTIPDPRQALPLIFFDASLSNNKTIRGVFEGLKRALNDFFDPLDEKYQPEEANAVMNPTASSEEMNQDHRAEEVNATMNPMASSGEMNQDHRAEEVNATMNPIASSGEMNQDYRAEEVNGEMNPTTSSGEKNKDQRSEENYPPPHFVEEDRSVSADFYDEGLTWYLAEYFGYNALLTPGVYTPERSPTPTSDAADSNIDSVVDRLLQEDSNKPRMDNSK